MKRFEIFKPGRHTAASGVTLEFSEDDMRRAVDAYDPAVHEAPIVVGHPKDNGPAYGWVGALSFADSGAIQADPIQVDADFAEMVSAGRFKKRSASWYMPGSANHPLKGTDRHDTYYLRHVGFLGAQPPAVKGLKEVAFSEDEGVVEFSDYDRFAWGTVATIMRGLREWIIGDKGVETADKVLPNYYLSELDDAAKAAREQKSGDDSTAGAMPAFSEEDPMKIEELQAQVAKLTAERDAALANAKPADFAERETNLAAREAAVAASQAKIDRAAVEARVDEAVKSGRLLPAQKKHAVDFAMGLTDGEAVIDFGEGDQAKKVTQREAYLLQIEKGPKVVDYGEHSRDDGGAPPESTDDIQRKLAAQVAGGKAK